MKTETKKTTTAVTTVASAQALAELKQSFPAEVGFTRKMLPRLGMISQDVTEGKGKTLKVVTEAGTFFIDKEGEEEDENGKKVWERTEIGAEIEATILYQRKQLRMYDETTETYTSSAVYDTEDEIIPLFYNKAEIARGTPAELKAREEYVFERDGKKKSKLEDNRILYVLYDGEIYQMNLRGTSMYSYMTFARKVLPPSLLVIFSSEPKDKGNISWNQMTFTEVRVLNQEELNTVLEKTADIKEGITEEKSFYASLGVQQAKAKSDLDEFDSKK